jgi:hypothetical protein
LTGRAITSQRLTDGGCHFCREKSGNVATTGSLKGDASSTSSTQQYDAI